MKERDPLIELLWELQPQLQRIFQRFRVSSDQAESMLEDAMMVLVYRYEQLARPDRWLLRTLRYRCIRDWRERRRKLCFAVDQEIRNWISDETISREERKARRVELGEHISQLPQQCRPLLRETYRVPESDDRPLPPPPNLPDFSLGAHKPEDPFVRCVTRLMRQLIVQRSSVSASLP
ncbi:MAG: hypothetical protein K0U98_01720 [Deltaproteobacteria bacterium]|nr:hypothetical protein [Deltaproteobacteria bacterium]